MGENILVSIITIVYNGQPDLERTIQSVLGQSYHNIQYIIIDGGSTDGTLETIKRFEHRIDGWLSEKDEGIADAFNKGLNMARGELIGLINCGDYYESSAVADMVKSYIALGSAPEEYIVMHGNIRMFNQHYDKTYVPFPLSDFRYRMPVWHPTIFVSHIVYKNFRYNKNYRISMDYELFSRVYALKGRFIYVNSLITNMNTNGVSNNNAAKGFKEVMYASRENLKVGPVLSYFYFIYFTVLNKLVTLVKKNA